MGSPGFWRRMTAYGSLLLLTVSGSGCRLLYDAHKQAGCCQAPAFNCCTITDAPVPKELNKVTLPPYVVEAPDILQIEAVRVTPLPPYRLEPFDVLYLSAQNVFEQFPIEGLYPIDVDGTVNLGPRYGGRVRVVDLTTEDAQKVLLARIRERAKAAELTVSLAQSRGAQQITGQYIVRPDGTISLGAYGSVYVAGLSLAQVKQAIEAHLSQYLYRPEVNVDVYAYNSKFYYVITDFAGNGEQVQRVPHTGNETVLDAVALVGGLSPVSSKKVWIARPSPTECGQDQILPVDWCGITRRGQVKTNYQIMPNDRVYILSQPLTKANTYLNRVLAPVNTSLNTLLLGASLRQIFQNGNGGVFVPIGGN
jgi:polysaccharide export outer membrane protein